jgi:23S rRNA (adenine-N6)-dimethyltransferase
VLDIGAGRGVITEALLSEGARVIAVELHPERVRHLRQRFGRRVVVVEADAGDLRLPRRPFFVVSSLPYSCTSRILRRLVHPASRLVGAHVIVQSQFAARWASAAAPAASRWQRAFDVRVGLAVPRRAFSPPPRVDSRVLQLRRA